MKPVVTRGMWVRFWAAALFVWLSGVGFGAELAWCFR
jgi:hypothetical protein